MASSTDPESSLAIDRRLFLLGLAATAACGDRGSEAASTTADPTTTASPTTTTTEASTTTAQVPTTLAPAPTTTTEPPLPDTVVERAAIDADIAATSVHFVEAAATYVVAVPEDLREPLKASLDPSATAGIDAGYLALYNKCTHLGCKVAPCDAAVKLETPEPTDDSTLENSTLENSTLENSTDDGAPETTVPAASEATGETILHFWCPCHASSFSILGEYRGGPATSGLFTMPMEVSETVVRILASSPADGLGREIDISGSPAGEAC